MSIDKKHYDEIKDIFDEDFEVTYEEDISLKQSDLQLDGYKDVLSVLSELDDTGSMDYLEANRTRTIDIGDSLEDAISLSHDEHHAKRKGLSDYFGDIFKKHE